MEVLWSRQLMPALLLWPCRLLSIIIGVSFYALLSNAPAIYKQASADHFLPQSLIFHSPPPPPA
jgi:hypothetical protein